jgi:hypothetical protein
MYALRSNGESGDILCTHAAEEIERLTLTDEERRVLRELRDSYAAEDDRECNQIAEVLDGLLERLK